MRIAVLGGIVCLFSSFVWADEFADRRLSNWHQWRGPEATGVAPQGDPPTTWDESSGANIKWKVAIPGRGSGSPVVWGDRIFLLTAIKTDRQAEEAEKTSATSEPKIRQVDFNESESAPQVAQREERPEGGRRGEGGRGRGGFGGGRRGGFGGGEAPTNYYQFVVLCLDRRTGETIWQRTACESVPHEGHHQTNSFASASAITDGKRVYAFFGSRGLYCYDLDGNPQWEKDFGDMKTRNGFGEGATPALSGDTLVVTWDHEGPSFIVALDAKTGDEKWRKDRNEVTSWATPLIIEAAGRTQVIVNGTERVRSYDFNSGDLLWECGGLGTNPIPCPIVLDNLVFSMTGHRDPALVAIPLDSTGDITGTEKIAWQMKDGPPYVSSALLYNGLLYFTKSRNAILSCVDAKTGEVLIDQKRLPEMESMYASPVGAAGRIYFSSREGTTLVIKQAKELDILATNRLNETIDASPAIVGKEMYIRGEGHLYCIAEK